MAQSYLTCVGTHALPTHTFVCGEAYALHLFPAHHRHLPSFLSPGPFTPPWVTPGLHPGPGLPHAGFSTQFSATFSIHSAGTAASLLPFSQALKQARHAARWQGV